MVQNKLQVNRTSVAQTNAAQLLVAQRYQELKQAEQLKQKSPLSVSYRNPASTKSSDVSSNKKGLTPTGLRIPVTALQRQPKDPEKQPIIQAKQTQPKQESSPQNQQPVEQAWKALSNLSQSSAVSIMRPVISAKQSSSKGSSSENPGGSSDVSLLNSSDSSRDKVPAA
jgi:hypothetical protein